MIVVDGQVLGHYCRGTQYVGWPISYCSSYRGRQSGSYDLARPVEDVEREREAERSARVAEAALNDRTDEV